MSLNLSNIKHVHFIGIGGIGISAIARMMLHEGKKVTGQDMQDSEIITELRKAGADITIGQSFDNIPSDADLIVYTIAIENYDPELFTRLKNQSIPIRSYPEMLHVVTEGKYTIAVAGTHGKTTTTGMIAQIFRDTDKDPTVIIGSLLIGEKSNFIAGKSEYFIVEACEYRRSFLNINPTVLVITNIDADHLDYYKDIEDIKNAFRELALKVPANGFVVCNPNDENIADVIKDIPATIIDVSKFLTQTITLKIPGIHNRKNASSSLAVAEVIGIPDTEARSALAQFPGTWRRFEYKGVLSSGAKVYDDYAHHPVEIEATLEGFRELYSRADGWKITIVFQPHLFSRTKLLLDEFAVSFAGADRVLLLPIYYAREEDDGSISSEILAQKISNTEGHAFGDFQTAESYIRSLSFDDKDIIVTMGAGEANKITDRLLL